MVVCVSWLWEEIFCGSDVVGVVVCGVLQLKREGAFVPRCPAKAVNVCARVFQSCAQVLCIELVVRVAAAGVPAAYSELHGKGSVVQGLAGAGLAVAFFQSPQVF